jgi:biopolymer transport protein ExbD
MARLRKNKRESLTPELTPLIDVVFLLLIFFMVSSVFKNEELSLMLQLPTAKEGQQGEAKAKNITIELSKGELAFNGKPLTFEELETKCAGLSKETIINLRVDGSVVYDRLVKALDILQRNKLENVSLITEKE